ncbi:biotin--[acetyl-CoA-carboxylase] ligase [Thermoleptolyngbya sp. M55_K2018_002]|uniref:biotin--[acetyl-CoA-carboxylase] ligase n=1 Tax=Thermoleptolyngbya sp. M55_K2018_002 TaxID=2747808 RepID=UPI0019FE9A11|nr:biotin--[acetyl-CoA-carboxylase] ligase [Thermoleptolyngbya sp. M55_K2018_002]HIK39744.1 biotin--[acetyl-CoA-carboxylase] ligase [Thermoleptolyngbya sp. M55_K2018_002]
MPFSLDRFYNALPAIAHANVSSPPDLAGLNVQVYEVLDSTNRAAWAHLAQHPADEVVVIAEQQRAGRGQWGRQWQSHPGGLYLSWGFRPSLRAEHAPQITLWSAWGVAIALRQAGVPVRLKWLNDLVVLGRKLGGVLTETRVQQGHIRQAVVGVGLNWANPVPEPGINLNTLQDQGYALKIASLEDLGAIALQGLRLGYASWQQRGTEALRIEYEALLSNCGQTITLVGDAETPGETVEIVGIGLDGQLRVQANHASGLSERLLPPGSIQLGYPAGTCSED